MRAVPRHEFVLPRLIDHAYEDTPLPIDNGQTISQPYIVALMTDSLNLEPGMRVLEIGTGSGYQAAVLAEMGMDVYTVEIIPELGSLPASVSMILAMRKSTHSSPMVTLAGKNMPLMMPSWLRLPRITCLSRWSTNWLREAA